VDRLLYNAQQQTEITPQPEALAEPIGS
jgi:hypothetical protein